MYINLLFNKILLVYQKKKKKKNILLDFISNSKLIWVF